jgi:hypothetical protein
MDKGTNNVRYWHMSRNTKNRNEVLNKRTADKHLPDYTVYHSEDIRTITIREQNKRTT